MQFEQEVVEMTRIRVTKRRKSTRLAALAALALAAMLVFPGIALAESPAQPDECSPSFTGPDDLVNPTPEGDDEIDDLANPTEDEDDEIDDLATPIEDDDDCDDLPDEVDGDEIPTPTRIDSGFGGAAGESPHKSTLLVPLGGALLALVAFGLHRSTAGSR
jgi:hypothetical protein